MERDLDIFMELAEGYRGRKRVRRRYPAFFETESPMPAGAR
jgi:hypothetical protein